jgi:hypothetical protein
VASVQCFTEFHITNCCNIVLCSIHLIGQSSRLFGVCSEGDDDSVLLNWSKTHRFSISFICMVYSLVLLQVLVDNFLVNLLLLC